MTEPRSKSILAVDIGSVNTRALLFDTVDGVVQMVGQGAGPTSDGDILAGMAGMLRNLSEMSGRRLLDDAGELITPEQGGRAGVDRLLTTSSAGAPLRVALLGLYPQGGLAAAGRAIAPFLMDVVAEIHLEDGLGAKGRLNRIVHSQPQLMLITGGTDGGARAVMLEMLALAREAISLMTPGKRPAVLYAGNSSLADAVRERLSQLTQVFIAPNIRGLSGDALEGTQAALGDYFNQVKRQSKRFRRIAAASDSGIVPTARPIETMTAFFARAQDQDVLTIDLGSARAMLALGRQGMAETAIYNAFGLGHSAAATLALVGEAEVARWLPFHPKIGELAQYTRGKALQPASLPLDMRARYIESALARAGIRKMTRALSLLDRGRLGLVIVAGAVFSGSALDMLLLADALDLDGALEVKADRYGALPALGTLAASQPEAVVQLVNGQVIEHVGTLARIAGKAATGSLVAKVEARRGEDVIVERELKAGELWHLPIPPGRSLDLRIQTQRGASIGGRRRLRLAVQGGRGGLLVDARLDAQSEARTMTQRAANMLLWYAVASGQAGPVAIPESWLAGDAD